MYTCVFVLSLKVIMLQGQNMCILVIIQGVSIHLSNNLFSQWFDMPFYYILNSYVHLGQWLDFVLHTFDLSV